jgi:hypothetical protein
LSARLYRLYLRPGLLFSTKLTVRLTTRQQYIAVFFSKRIYATWLQHNYCGIRLAWGFYWTTILLSSSSVTHSWSRSDYCSRGQLTEKSSFNWKRLFIVTNQINCLILVISLFEVKSYTGKWQLPQYTRSFLLNLDTFKICNLIGLSRQLLGRSSVLKKSQGYEVFSASWPTGELGSNRSVISCGFPTICCHKINKILQFKQLILQISNGKSSD